MTRFTLDFQTFNRKKLNDRVTFPTLLNMNHFMEDQKLQTFEETQKLIADNPLLNIRPSQFKAATFKQQQAKAKTSAPVKNESEKAYEEAVNNAL